MDLIKELYESPEGLQSSAKLWSKIKELRETDSKYANIKLKDVKEFYAKNPVTQITKPIRKSKVHRQILAREPKHIYQMDLLDVSNLASANNGINYLLTCIDVDSRYVWAVPLKTKSSEAVWDAFETIPKPEEVSTDNGGEFTGLFTKLCNKNGIIHVLNQPGDHNHMGIIESFHRTLRLKIAKYQLLNKTKSYIKALPQIIAGYNKSIHSTIKAKPIDVFNGKDTNHQELKPPNEAKFRPGDNVRVQVKQKLFDKRSLPGWSSDVYEIVKQVKNKYLTTHSDHLYRASELQLTTNLEPLYPLKEKVDEAIQKKKVKQILKRDDIKQSNVLPRRSARLKK